MKRTFILMGVIVLAVLSFSSCKSMVTGSGGNGPTSDIESILRSVNEFDLNIADEPITYTIDISTPEGEAKLNKLTMNEAKNLAYREAIMNSKCAVILKPQFTYQTYGKKIIRMTVYGFPAVYKNKKR